MHDRDVPRRSGEFLLAKTNVALGMCCSKMRSTNDMLPGNDLRRSRNRLTVRGMLPFLMSRIPWEGLCIGE